MSKIYNQIGSLRVIKSHLQNNNIHEFNSINQLLNFQKEYNQIKSDLIEIHSKLILKEKTELVNEIEKLTLQLNQKENELSDKLNSELEDLRSQLDSIELKKENIYRFFSFLRKFILNHRIKILEHSFESRINIKLKGINDLLITKKDRYNFINNNFNEAVRESCFTEQTELERKKIIIDELNTSILGAIGEQKVSKYIKNFTDDYILINDFSYTFQEYLYYKQENDYIKSIQIDHILIGPSGIFLIETKNWSESSMNNINLRSPVKQIRRSSFATFKLLNNYSPRLTNHHWGERKIPIRNIIVLINNKPKEEFQYVKILTLNELQSYIDFFKPFFSTEEINQIANQLLRLNENYI